VLGTEVQGATLGINIPVLDLDEMQAQVFNLITLL